METEKILNKIKAIEDTLAKIKSNMPKEFDEFEKLDLIKDGIYKKIEFAIQSSMDILEQINKDLNLGIPEKEESIIEHLRLNNILSKALAERLQGLKGFRNILVHKYGDIDDEQAFDNIHEGLKDFDKLISEIKSFLKKK